MGLERYWVHREQKKWDMVSAAVSGQGLFGASLVLCNYSYALRNKVYLGAHRQGSVCSNVCPLQDCVAISACVLSTFPVPCLLSECLLRLAVWGMAVGSPSLTGRGEQCAPLRLLCSACFVPFVLELLGRHQVQGWPQAGVTESTATLS